MANVKITELTAETNPASTDVLPIVDVSTDLTKKVSIADLLKNAGTGSAAAPSYSFDGDNDTGIYRPAANQIALTTAGTERLRIDSGRLLVGTTSATGSYLLQVNSDATINSLTIGRGAGNISTNTATGYQALYNNTTGINNTATGDSALLNNTTGFQNTATGKDALDSNTTGNNNTATGNNALYSNTTGGSNTALGRNALYSNTTAGSNTATGHSALLNNTTGDSNTATGYQALYSNTTGNDSVAAGYRALFSNTTGINNTALGRSALQDNTTGDSNTALGRSALQDNTTGINNTALGRSALLNNTTGSGNIGVAFANSAGSYAPVFDPTTENNRLVLGHASITNAYVKVAWTVTSDARDKMNFAPVPYGLDFVNQLKPTAYQFKVDRDTETPSGDVRYGFKAQDILALEGDKPVIIDTEDADHLKYKGEHLVPVLVNAVQELTAMLKELKSELAALKGA